MVTAVGPVESISPSEFHRITDVCYHGFVWGTRAALHHMRPRNRGIIIQVGSAMAYRSIPLQAAYCGAKQAIRGFTDALRCELLHDRRRGRRAEARPRRALAMTPARRATRARLAGALYVCS